MFVYRLPSSASTRIEEGFEKVLSGEYDLAIAGNSRYIFSQSELGSPFDGLEGAKTAEVDMPQPYTGARQLDPEIRESLNSNFEEYKQDITKVLSSYLPADMRRQVDYRWIFEKVNGIEVEAVDDESVQGEFEEMKEEIEDWMDYEEGSNMPEISEQNVVHALTAPRDGVALAGDIAGTDLEQSCEYGLVEQVDISLPLVEGTAGTGVEIALYRTVISEEDEEEVKEILRSTA